MCLKFSFTSNSILSELFNLAASYESSVRIATMIKAKIWFAFHAAIDGNMQAQRSKSDSQFFSPSIHKERDCASQHSRKEWEERCHAVKIPDVLVMDGQVVLAAAAACSARWHRRPYRLCARGREPPMRLQAASSADALRIYGYSSRLATVRSVSRWRRRVRRDEPDTYCFKSRATSFLYFFSRWYWSKPDVF